MLLHASFNSFSGPKSPTRPTNQYQSVDMSWQVPCDLEPPIPRHPESGEVYFNPKLSGEISFDRPRRRVSSIDGLNPKDLCDRIWYSNFDFARMC